TERPGIDGVTSQRTHSPNSLRSEARYVFVYFPQDEPNRMILRRFIRIFSSLNVKMEVIGDSKISPGVGLFRVDLPCRPGILRYSLFQARLTIALWRTRRSWDAAWFLGGGTAMAVPIAATRVAGKKAVLVWVGSSARQAIHQHGLL